jgi:broad specificity phosphatase PhoE
MVTFYLIRHGQKEEALGNPSLTILGKQQAKITAKYLKNKKIKKIYASPRKRTIQTASIIAKELNLQITQDERLKERMIWGGNTKVSFDEFLDEWIKTDLDRSFKPRFGDSSIETGKRMESLINEINLDTNSNVLLVSHGGAIADFLRNNFSDSELPIVKYKRHDAMFLKILECSITIVEKKVDKFLLKQVGSIDHLPVPMV